jgi:hypothetical protein
MCSYWLSLDTRILLFIFPVHLFCLLCTGSCVLSSIQVQILYDCFYFMGHMGHIRNMTRANGNNVQTNNTTEDTGEANTK